MEKKIADAQQDNEQEEKEQYLKLVVDNVTGGKEPPDGETWLDKMPIGSCFLAKEARNPMEFVLGLFRIGSRSGKATVLNSPQIPGNLYVDPVAFCNKYRCYEDLGVMITPDEEKEIANDDGDRLEPDSGHPDGKVE
jgi:hypothetical protein